MTHARTHTRTKMKIHQPFHESPVRTNLLVVPFGKKDTDVSAVHAFVKSDHLSASIDVKHFHDHLRMGVKQRKTGRG